MYMYSGGTAGDGAVSCTSRAGKTGAGGCTARSCHVNNCELSLRPKHATRINVVC